jgi:hypothetical protein
MGHVELDAEIAGPPGLWLAERTRPPMALCLRMTQEAAGVDRSPFCPTRTRPNPLAAAILSAVWTTLSLKKRPSPPITRVEPFAPSTVSKIAWMKFST